jgi:hypothetical protein
MRLTSLSPADKAFEADGAGLTRLTRLESPSPADEALEANGARPMRLKRQSPAGKADEANGPMYVTPSH